MASIFRLGVDKLREICTELNSLRFMRGTVELALSAARYRARSFSPPHGGPSTVQQSDQDLKGCYDLALGGLEAADRLFNEAVAAPDNLSLGTFIGKYVQLDNNSLI